MCHCLLQPRKNCPQESKQLFLRLHCLFGLAFVPRVNDRRRDFHKRHPHTHLWHSMREFILTGIIFQVALKRQQAVEDAIAMRLASNETGKTIESLPPGKIYGMTITQPSETPSHQPMCLAAESPRNGMLATSEETQIPLSISFIASYKRFGECHRYAGPSVSAPQAFCAGTDFASMRFGLAEGNRTM